MSCAEEIIDQQKQIEEELKIAMQEERNAALAVVDDKIKCLNITATELKGLIKSRVKQQQAEDFLKRKKTAKNQPELPAEICQLKIWLFNFSTPPLTQKK